MSYIVRMPQLGMSMDEGTVVEWVVEEGDSIEEGDIIVAVESEKASNDVEARESGALRQVLHPEGAVVEPGTPIGIVAEQDDDLSEFEDALSETSTGPEDDTPPAEETKSAQQAETGNNESSMDQENQSTNVKATPGARKLAAENDVVLNEIDGTGPQGVITDEDVEESLTTGETVDDGVTQTVVENRELSGVQATIRDRLGESYREAIHVTLNRSVDTEDLQAVVTAAQQRGQAVSLIDLLLKAVGDVLQSYPEFNALYENDEHRLISEANLNLAIDTETGLVSPVIPEVTTKSAEEIHTIRKELTERVQAGEFTMDDLSGGTFTISNLGIFGVDNFDPIINPPQIAILGVGRIRDDESMTLSLSFDHRVVNGADAARFLDSLTERLTDDAVLAAYFETDVPTENGLDDREVVVENQSHLRGRYQTAYGSVKFDEPEAMGGSGSAPSPVDHLLGALGACLSLSLRTMADRDGVEVNSVQSTIVGEPESGPLTDVTVTLEIDTEAASADVKKLVTKAERACYVARSLSDDLAISVEWNHV